MCDSTSSKVVSIARDYYDSSDADSFYFNIWGGEDIHIGLYESLDDSIRDASHRTVEAMATMVSDLPDGARILDIGAGYGGSARHLASSRHVFVTCLNLSVVQNERNREFNRNRGLENKIDVVDGDFEALPFEDKTFDLVWSQDAILHSGDRFRVFQEVDRVLKNGGRFLFSDPMQRFGVEQERLKPVLDRIHLETLGSVDDYEKYAQKLGWKSVEIDEHPKQLVNHYTAVLRNLENRHEELIGSVSADYLENMKKGLQHWIEAGSQGLLNWGFLLFAKPE